MNNNKCLIAPNFQKGDPSDFRCYRPFTCVCCKTSESPISGKVLTYLTKNNMITKPQHAFLKTLNNSTFIGITLWLDFFNTIFVSSHTMYVPREPRRDTGNCRLNEHGIYIRHCQESNSQPVPSQAGADPSVPLYHGDRSLCTLRAIDVRSPWYFVKYTNSSVECRWSV